MLRLSGIARSTFYYYLKSKDTDKYKEVKDDILIIFNQNKGRYGYRRILSVLKQKGYTINHKTVLKLMNELNIKGKENIIRTKGRLVKLQIICFKEILQQQNRLKN